MGKVRRLITRLVERDYLLRAGGSFIAILGFLSVILTIVGEHFELKYAVFVPLVAILLAAIANWPGLKVPQVAIDDFVPEDIDRSFAAVAHCPCDSRLAGEASRLAETCFAGTVTITPERYASLLSKNRYILVCLASPSGEFFGYFDVIPLKESFALSLLDGIVTEDQIRDRHILTPEEMKSCKYVFLAGLAARNPKTYTGRRHADMLVWSLLKYLEEYYVVSKPLCIALAATRSGEQLLSSFKLYQDGDRHLRLDKYQLYSIRLTKDAIEKRLGCVRDWAGICKLSWETQNETNGTQKLNRPLAPKSKRWNLKAGTGSAGVRKTRNAI